MLKERSNFRIPRNSFTCHWIRIASIVLCLDLQSLPTHVSEAEMSCGVFWSLAKRTDAMSLSTMDGRGHFYWPRGWGWGAAGFGSRAQECVVEHSAEVVIQCINTRLQDIITHSFKKYFNHRAFSYKKTWVETKKNENTASSSFSMHSAFCIFMNPRT